MTINQSLSIILPAYNESMNIAPVIRELVSAYPHAEILVIDDCSTDNTAELARNAGARVIRQAYNMGNGAAVKAGGRHAKGDILVFMDADGQHQTDDIALLLSKIEEGYDLVVGSRSSQGQASKGRLLGNRLLNKFASMMTQSNILDLTSGFRATRASLFRQFLYLLPNGFSYPTTSTMAFFRSGLAVTFVPINVQKRTGTSKINFIQDGIRFLVIIMKVTTLFSPMRLFLPVSLLLFIAGIIRYVYFFWQTNSFSSMAGVLLISAGLVFMIGLVSEQITALHYAVSHSKLGDHEKIE